MIFMCAEPKMTSIRLPEAFGYALHVPEYPQVTVEPAARFKVHPGIVSFCRFVFEVADEVVSQILLDSFGVVEQSQFGKNPLLLKDIFRLSMQHGVGTIREALLEGYVLFAILKPSCCTSFRESRWFPFRYS